jgi:hypothetical protein
MKRYSKQGGRRESSNHDSDLPMRSSGRLICAEVDRVAQQIISFDAKN